MIRFLQLHPDEHHRLVLARWNKTRKLPGISDVQGALVYDCRPPLLPASLQLEDIGALPLRRTVASASLAAPPQVDLMEIGGASPEMVAVPELQKALLCVSILPEMVTPLEEPVEGFPTAPSSYPEPPVPVLSYVDPDASSRSSPMRVAADVPEMDVFQSYLPSPAACSVYEPATSPVTPYLQEDAASQPGYDGPIPIQGRCLAVGRWPCLDCYRPVARSGCG